VYLRQQTSWVIHHSFGVKKKMVRWTRAIVVLAAAAAASSASAFVVPPKSNAAATSNFVCVSTTALFGNTKMPAQADDPITQVFGEESRRYRRTVFTHDDWVRHRSPDRFWRNVKTFFTSGVYKNIGNEVAVVTAVATFIVIYNALLGGYTDFSGVQHEAVIQNSLLPKLGLPLTPFTLSSPSLGLLLGKILFVLDFTHYIIGTTPTLTWYLYLLCIGFL
jgi:ion channel-forming bestrophin family protein